VFWIWDENNVDNILMFLVLLGSEGFFSFSHWPGLQGAQEAGRGRSWDS